MGNAIETLVGEVRSHEDPYGTGYGICRVDGLYEKLMDHPLAPLFDSPDFSYHFERHPKDLQPGDLCIHFDMRWQIVMATGAKIGRRDVYYEGDPANPRSILHCEHPDYRVGRIESFTLPPLRMLPMEQTHSPQPILEPEELTIERDLRYTVTDIDYVGERVTREYELVRINTLQEISFVGDDRDNSMLAYDYFLESRHGVPVIISDYHHKLPVHIAQLVIIGKLPNIRPYVDWLDFHNDWGTDFELPHFRNIPLKRYSDICAQVGSTNCASAGALAKAIGAADLRYFEPLMGSEISFMGPPWRR